jgi:ribonuclease Z
MLAKTGATQPDSASLQQRMLMRFLVLSLIVVLFAAALAFIFRGPVAERVMERALERSMAVDVIADLPDGLHLALCGAGAPLPDPVRSGPCVAVAAGNTLLVVDAGTNGARNLQRMGLTPGRIEAVFLTHFHSDHIDGLGELALMRWTTGSRTTPLPVHGPTGVASVVDGFNAAYALDSSYRTAHHGPEVAPPDGAGSVARAFDAPPPGTGVEVWRTGGLTVTAFAVPHAPASPAVGYRFDYGGRSLVVSGDTSKSDNLVHFAEDVDLLVHEALAVHLVAIMNRAARHAGRDNVASIAHDILDYHTTPVEAAQVATAARARHLLYYHVLPPLRVPGLAAAFLEGVDAVYKGPVTLGRDGTFVSLPAGSDTIVVSERL